MCGGIQQCLENISVIFCAYVLICQSPLCRLLQEVVGEEPLVVQVPVYQTG